jgi:hypothetical protein
MKYGLKYLTTLWNWDICESENTGGGVEKDPRLKLVKKEETVYASGYTRLRRHVQGM